MVQPSPTTVRQKWCTVVGERRDTPDGLVRPTRPADADLAEVYRAGLAETISVLSAADPAQPNWTWADDHSAGFVIRRMAQETAIHNWDAQRAAGRDVPIDAALASDGIDEFLTHFRDEAQDGVPPVAGSVHLHCTDVAGEWMVRPRPDGGTEVVREHAKGDAAIRGAASDILLALWRRRGVGTVDVVGDADVAARFVAFPALD